ncbi:MAG: hypothetical protein K8I00_13145, partial [Candidatus Omnitrophica bacterium]|nr:hypothetical protein [Candidatus Omnitrophota bacterium]
NEQRETIFKESSREDVPGEPIRLESYIIELPGGDVQQESSRDALPRDRFLQESSSITYPRETILLESFRTDFPWDPRRERPLTQEPRQRILQQSLLDESPAKHIRPTTLLTETVRQRLRQQRALEERLEPGTVPELFRSPLDWYPRPVRLEGAREKEPRERILLESFLRQIPQQRYLQQYRRGEYSAHRILQMTQLERERFDRLQLERMLSRPAAKDYARQKRPRREPARFITLDDSEAEPRERILLESFLRDAFRQRILQKYRRGTYPRHRVLRQSYLEAEHFGLPELELALNRRRDGNITRRPLTQTETDNQARLERSIKLLNAPAVYLKSALSPPAGATIKLKDSPDTPAEPDTIQKSSRANGDDRNPQNALAKLGWSN